MVLEKKKDKTLHHLLLHQKGENLHTIFYFQFPAMCFDTADVYVAMEKDTEASACVQEVHLIFPFSPDVLFQV